ncbi:mitotic spindle checkpoint protein BUBR1 [Euphorbia lathyris]|uniref:mitotic spindle checkpoint protein BUBR1 n=1 Tax=Euphorbia lathyris TaxID=212925 RepID=UPI003313BDFB
MADIQVVGLDPESQFLASKEETGHEWELFKENVRPLKRGRNVRLLNDALKSHTQNNLKSLLETRRRLIEAIDEYKGDDPLLPWIECIKWVQESFPPCGDSSGLVVIYEQCVRAFWHSDRYKDDLRYLKVWLEYAENCTDAEVIYDFLDANEIGKSHSIYYIAYASHMESKSKMKTSNDIFNLGISRDARPIEKLKDAYKKFLIRSMRMQKHVEGDVGENHLPTRSFGTVLVSEGNRRRNMEDIGENHLPTRSFGTSLVSEGNRRRNMETSEVTRNKMKSDRVQKAPLSIYKDTTRLGHQSGKPKTDHNPWNNLGARAERNKENTAIPTKWKTFKVPQSRVGPPPPSVSIEVFVDDECTESQTSQDQGSKSSDLQNILVDSLNIKKETGLLMENPLRNFPNKSLPR